MKLLRALIAASMAFMMAVEPITASGFGGWRIQGLPECVAFDNQAVVPFLSWFTSPSVFRRLQSQIRRWLPSIEEKGTLTITLWPLPRAAGEIGADRPWDGKIRMSWPTEIAWNDTSRYFSKTYSTLASARREISYQDLQKEIVHYIDRTNGVVSVEDIVGALNAFDVDEANVRNAVTLLAKEAKIRKYYWGSRYVRFSSIRRDALDPPMTPAVKHVLDVLQAQGSLTEKEIGSLFSFKPYEYSKVRPLLRQWITLGAIQVGTGKGPRTVYTWVPEQERIPDKTEVAALAEAGAAEASQTDIVLGAVDDAMMTFRSSLGPSRGIIFKNLTDLFAHRWPEEAVAQAMEHLHDLPHALRIRLKLSSGDKRRLKEAGLIDVGFEVLGVFMENPFAAPRFDQVRIALHRDAGQTTWLCSQLDTLIRVGLVQVIAQEGVQRYAWNWSWDETPQSTLKSFRSIPKESLAPPPKKPRRPSGWWARFYRRAKSISRWIPQIEEWGTLTIPILPQLRPAGEFGVGHGWDGTIRISWPTKIAWSYAPMRMDDAADAIPTSSEDPYGLNDLPIGLSVIPIQMTRPVDGESQELRGEIWTVDLEKVEPVHAWAENYRVRDLAKEFHQPNDPNVGKTIEWYVEDQESPGDVILGVNNTQEGFVMNNTLLVQEGQLIQTEKGRRDILQALPAFLKTPYQPPHGVFHILSLDPGRPGIFDIELDQNGDLIGTLPVREGFAGPLIMRNGQATIDGESGIQFGRQPSYAGDDVNWLSDKRQAFSAFGYDGEGRLVIVQLAGTSDDPEKSDPNLSEAVDILKAYGVRDAILSGTSADVQRYSPFLNPSFVWTRARKSSIFEKAVGTPRGRRVGTALLFRRRRPAEAPGKVLGAVGAWTWIGLRNTHWIGLIEGILTGLYGWYVLAGAMPADGFLPVWSAVAMAVFLPFAKAIGVTFFLHYLTGVIVPGKDKPVTFDLARSFKATGAALSGFVGLPFIGIGLGMSDMGAFTLIGLGVLAGGVLHGALNFNSASMADQTVNVYEEIAEHYADLTAASPHSNFLREHLPAFLQGLPHGKILDVGSGAGAFVRWFYDQGRQAFGMDSSENLLRIARERQTSVPRTAWLRGDMRNWFFSPSSFAGIWSAGSLHHVLSVNEVRRVLRNFYRTLLPHGRLFVSVKEGEGVRTESDGRTYRYFHIDELSGLLKVAGFRILKSGSEGGDRSRWVYVLAEANKTSVSERVILLDMGNVMVPIDPARIINQLVERGGLSEERKHEFFDDVTYHWKSDLVNQFMDGRLSSEQFYAHVKEQMGLSPGLEFDHFKEIWQQIIAEQSDLKVIDQDTVRRLKQDGYKVIGFSNTDPMHYERFQTQPGLRETLSELDGFYSSYDLGGIKPNPAVYGTVLERLRTEPGLASLRPEQILFVDDNSLNLQTARQEGWETYLFTDRERFLSWFDERRAENDFIRADGRTRGSGKIERATLSSWAGISLEDQERLLKRAISRHETEDLSRAAALLAPLEQGKPLRIAFVPREFKADPRRPLMTLLDMFRWQRATQSAQLKSFFTSWDSPEDIQSHVWVVPGRPNQKVLASINLRRALRPGGGQPAKDCVLCNSVIQTKFPTELGMRLGSFMIYFNPFPVDPPKRHAAFYYQPLRSVMVWAASNAPDGHVSQGDIYQVPYLREARMQWMRLNAGFFLAWFKKFRIEINGWGYGKEGNHGGATQDHVHMHLSRKLYSSEKIPVTWSIHGIAGSPGVAVGLMNLLPGQSAEGSGDVMLLVLEAEGSYLRALDEAVSRALHRIAEEKDSFDVLYTETYPRTAAGWAGFILRKLGLGPWLPESLGPRVRVLLTGRIKAQASDGTPLGAYQITGLENVIEGNPSRYYRLSGAQKAEYESTQPLENKIALVNRWLEEGAIVRLSDQELFENFRSELQQTAYARAQVEALFAHLRSSGGRRDPLAPSRSA